MPTTAADIQPDLAIPLRELTQIRQRFLRSVNLERDFYSPDPLEGYVPTPAALSALERIVVGIGQPDARAISLTGAYGTGKSAFALFAAKVLAAPPVGVTAVRTQACSLNPTLQSLLFANDAAGYWPVLVTGAREPLARALVRGLLRSIERLPAKAMRALQKRLEAERKDILEAETPTAREVTELIETASALARKHLSGCEGLVVVVDEMGKFLEYAALHPEQGDMQALQELAESAVRSVENPILLVTILHQAFEEYAFRLSGTQRTEWRKVQGRFADIPFGDSPEESLRLLAKAIAPQEVAEAESVLANVLEHQVEWCRQLHLVPKAIASAEFGTMLRQTYPLHPLTLLVMPTLFQRFGQNERSLFSFLSSEEPSGFKEFLREHTLTTDDAPLLRLDYLYDYAVFTLGSTLYAHPTAKLWSETEEALHRLQDRYSLQSRVVKTVGLLHILGEQTRILPSKEVLTFALTGRGVNAADVEAAIDALETMTLITYRRFKKAYRLYEGSDVDIDARVREARPHFLHGADVVETARTQETMPPIVARRHSYETGTLRLFDVRYCFTFGVV